MLQAQQLMLPRLQHKFPPRVKKTVERRRILTQEGEQDSSVGCMGFACDLLRSYLGVEVKMQVLCDFETEQR